MKPNWKNYRKKPVVIQAFLWKEKMGAIGPVIAKVGSSADGEGYPQTYFCIETLEGLMGVSNGDYVIKGIKGEFYNCKPDVFALTYEPAKEIIPEELKRQERAAITALISATEEKLAHLKKLLEE